MKIFMKKFIILIVFLFLSLPAWASHPVSKDVFNHIKGGRSSDIRDIQNFPSSWLPDSIKSFFIITMPEDRTKIILTGRGKDGIFYDFGRIEFNGELNIAKTDVFYDEEDGLIHIYSQMPYSAFYYGASYRWDKESEKLVIVKEWHEDPSADTLKEVESLLASGEIDKASEKLNTMFYPGHYYDTCEMEVKFLRSAHKKALEEYRKGSNDGWKVIKTAISVLGDKWVFHFNSQKDYEKSDFNKYMTYNDFISAVNDYGFFMEQAGKTGDAIFVITYVLKLSPGRTPAHLNLADALYKGGSKEEAKKYYKTYMELMKKEGKEIPSRVYKRL